MKLSTFTSQMNNLSIGEGDHVFTAYFNKEEDKFCFYDRNCDIGDAIIIINGLMKHYSILPQALLSATNSYEEFDLDKTLADMTEMMRVLKEAKDKFDSK